MDSPKVFEYAKSIGMETLALMDKLRDWNIPVKNHMAQLDSDTIQLIEQKFNESKAVKEAAKKIATRKAKAPAAEAKEKAAPKAAAKKSASPTKAATKKTSDKKESPAKKDAAPAPGAKGGKVIRRKAGDLAAQAKEEADAKRAAEEEAAATAAAAAAVAEETAQAEAATARAAEAVHEPVAATPQTPATAAPATTPVVAPATPAEPPRFTRSVKKEVVPGTGRAPSSTPSNIIGRIDLNRQHQNRPRPPAHQQPRQQTTTVRTGFMQQPAYIPTEEPARRERRRPTAAKPGGGPVEEAGVTKEEEVENFVAADFKKRELVFQPKKKKATLGRPSMKTSITTARASKRVVKMYDKIKVSEFAKELGIKVAQLTTTLMKQGITVTPNDVLDYDTAALIAPEFKFEVENTKKTSQEVMTEVAFGNVGAAATFRTPVVTVMGHVDHGKTSLLDAIRSADVAKGEAGGITQHIGAYKVKTENGHVITFIDTPGHEAFTAMRARGANVTDIVILVVAADDGVMPQTAEAVSHAKNAGVPIIVAVNKMDKPGANPERVKQQLTEFELVAEEWGGQTAMIPVSAMKKTGIKELLDQVIAQAEIMELKANADRSATGAVLESRMERGRGIVATLLVKNGTMRIGQFICAGASYGRVRAMFNDRGQAVKEALPADPVEVLGLTETPRAGDVFDVCKDERAAQELAAKHKEEQTKQIEAPKAKLSLEDLFGKVEAGDVKDLPIVLKTDVVGSLEALRGLLEKTASEKVKVKIIHAAVGGVSESDVLLASSSKGIIIGFNVRPEGGAAALAKSQGVEIKSYSIVYEVVDDIKRAMVGMLDPTFVENTLGRAEVRNTFSIPKIGMIAGCYVVDGKVVRSATARLVREGRVIYEGKITSLKRFKDDAREVATGFECGIGIENYNDVKVGDVIEAFEKKQVEGTL